MRDVKARLSERNGVQGVVVVVVVGRAVGVVAVAGAIGVVAVADAAFRCSSRRSVAGAVRGRLPVRFDDTSHEFHRHTAKPV